MTAMTVRQRSAAVFTLAALLACSSLGVCWRVFAADAHDCCRRGDGIAAPTRNACSSDVTALAPTELAPPTASMAYVAPPAAASSGCDVLALVLPAKAPPLVLRI
jgi:hypothetical protein